MKNLKIIMTIFDPDSNSALSTFASSWSMSPFDVTYPSIWWYAYFCASIGLEST